MTASPDSGASGWKRALERMLDDEEDGALEASFDDGPSAQVGLEFDLQLPLLRRVRQAAPAAGAPYTLGMRPVRRGARGTWIRGGLDWERVVDAGRTGVVSPEQADWFDELRVLANVRSRQVAHDRHWIRVEHYESPMLWSLLERAEQLDVSLVSAGGGRPVVLDPAGRFQVDLSRDEDHGLVLHPEVVVEEEGLRRVIPLTSAGVVGDPGHGLFFPVAEDDAPPAFSGSAPEHLDPESDLNAMSLRLVPLSTRLTRDQRRFLETAQEMTVPDDEVQEFVERWFPRLQQRIAMTSDDGSIELPDVAAPEMVLTVTHDDLTVRLEWEWEYQLGAERLRLPFRPADPLGTEPVRRDSTWESSMTTAVHRRIPDLEFRRSAYVGYDAVVLLRDWLPELERIHDLRIETRGTEPAYRPSQDPPEITVSTASSQRRDWFDLGVSIRVGDFHVAFADIFKALAQGQDVMMLPDGTWFGLDAPRFEKLRELLKEARSLQDTPSDAPMISRHQLGLWEEFEELADRSEPVSRWREAVTRLSAGLEEEDPPEVPQALHAQLRPYQVDGFRWLAALHDLGLGGVLADDMGLGKTVQTIAMFQRAHDRAAEGLAEAPAGGPFLVVAPTSVAPNWVSEIRRFAPELSVRSMPGTAAATGEEPQQLAGAHDVVVISYALLRLDEQLWSAIDFSAVVLDEAQFVKNPRTRAHRAARALRTDTTIAVTGTPLENGLTDLWALLALTAPGLFPSRRRFAEAYQRPIETSGDRTALSRMRRRLAPFMLRRTKESVDLQLPPKIEQTLEIELSEEHRRLYDLHLQRERSKVLGLLQDLNGNRFTIFQSLTKLRLMALDPSLVDPEMEVPSSKLEVLFDHLPEIVAEGHRPLVFSQFTGFLKLAAARLDRLGIPYSYLDGSTRDRATAIEDFRSGRTRVFLVSLKAGGTGLNLVEADYCFLLDPWWNPMAENQAIDRAHRIGQTRKVLVYRLIAQGTIEQKVMELKSRKAALFDSVMDDDGTFASQLSADDVLELLRD
ncbi:UNVERIFIED_CONTAM: DEAD/DEAH box helicase [Kocuria sp. CPCC 205295]|uniref:Helicase n=1 Tax=Kocuria palustris PEL TaxID=1236550 RepID=M2YBB3_9MICC|nr:DEAD/DEAH box helicase [Kocuria palustris]EME35904.1 hypothetical protein C884_01304 [Kocuria palustris PEL]